jgi:hypothetical protein
MAGQPIAEQMGNPAQYRRHLLCAVANKTTEPRHLPELERPVERHSTTDARSASWLGVSS